MGVGIYIQSTATGNYGYFALAAVLASSIAGFLIWYFGSHRGALRVSTGRGVLLGILSAIVGHHLTWVFQAWAYYTCALAFNLCRSSLGEMPMNYAEAIIFTAPLTLFSYIFFGWLTIPVGALTGFLFARAK